MTSIEKWIEQVRSGSRLDDDSLIALCKSMKALLLEEPNNINVQSPVVVCGDVHGQFYDLLEIFKLGGQPPKTKYIFLGDYVNRGINSVETITYLMLLKMKYPHKITLLRGNHECREMCLIFGFFDEVKKKYPRKGSQVFQHCCEVFCALPLTAVIDNHVFCVHGGISPEIKTIDQIGLVDRNREMGVTNDEPIYGLTWSDPNPDDETWSLVGRSPCYSWGTRVVKEFFRINNLKMMIRSHQFAGDEGYNYKFDETVLTIFSAPDYCYRCGNRGAFVKVKNAKGKKIEKEIVTFTEVEEHTKQYFARLKQENDRPMYFL